MQPAARRVINGPRLPRIALSIAWLRGPLALGLWIAGLWSGFAVLVWIYELGLRDARYLDGWVLAVGMLMQVGFHAAVRASRLSVTAMRRWRGLHVFLGYVLIGVFLIHTSAGLPETALEWALWCGFVLVSLTGVLGSFLAWSLRTRLVLDAGLTLETIPQRRAEIVQIVDGAVTREAPPPGAAALPLPPYDGWILDLYVTHLRDFLHRPRLDIAQLFGSRRPLHSMIAEIDALMPFVDAERQERLVALKDVVGEIDRLDLARVHLVLTRGWLLVHVPVTYALSVLSVLHTVSVYAFSSGAW